MFIIINNETIEVAAVKPSMKGIAFIVSDIAIEDAVARFSEATELKVADEEAVCGIYKGLTFESATVDAYGKVTVNFHIKDETEKRIDDLEKKCAELEEQNAELKQAQEMQNEQNAEQDELLAEILFGTEGETELVEEILEEQGEKINE